MLRFGLFLMLSGVMYTSICSHTEAAGVILLKDGFVDSSSKIVSAIKNASTAYGITIRETDMDSLPGFLENASAPRTILLLPNSPHFPANAKTALDSFLKRGNHLMALSGLPFSDMATKNNNKWINHDSMLQELAQQSGNRVIDFSTQELKSWSRASGTMSNKTVYEIVNSELQGAPKALHAQIGRLDDWETLACGPIDDPFPDGASVTVFWAKGGQKTPELILEWVEKDGSRWMGVVKLTTYWKRYALTPSDFTFWQDKSPANRGGEGDRFNPANAERLSVGLSNGISKQEMGIAHEYWVAGIESVQNPNSEIDFNQPIIESISPAYKLFYTRMSAGLVPETGSIMSVVGNAVASIPRSRGLGSDALRSARQIPLFEALDISGRKCGTIAHLYLNNKGPYTGSIFGYVGLSQSDLEMYADYAGPMIAQTLGRMQKGLFLANAGTDSFAYTTGEAVKVGAYVTNLGESAVKADVKYSIYLNDKLVHSSSSTLESAARKEPAAVSGTPVKLKEGEYTVRTTLTVNGNKIDEISHTFHVIKPAKLTAKNTISAKDGDFYLDGKKWYGVGMNYWPRYSVGQEPSAYWLHWLHPEQYDPEIIEDDMATAEKLGMNLFSIQYGTVAQARTLMDFLARAERHGIKVNIFIPGLHPLWKDFAMADEMIKSARLWEFPAVFAYDLGWEVHVGPYETRKSFDWQWQDWVVDRYGSIENAEKDWKYTPQRQQDIITGPTDQQLVTDGDWSTYVAAYRRFWDSRFSEGYRTSRANVKSLDKYHLIGARSGWGGLGGLWPATQLPIDLLSGVKHLDFTSPEGYNIGGDRKGFLRGGFDSAYARFVSRGKPVFWAEYGNPLFTGLLPSAYRPGAGSEKQSDSAKYYQSFLAMIFETGGNASAGWWWPGGLRIDERSDYGIINPDNTPRPAAMEIARAAAKHKTARNIRKPDMYITVDRDKYASGYAGVYAENAPKWIELFLDGKYPGIKTEGTDTTSVDTPLVAVGNLPYNGNNPLKYLDSEFNYIKINGKEIASGSAVEVKSGEPVYLEASIGNIGEAGWLTPKSAGKKAGGVYLQITGLGEKKDIPIRRNTPYLEDAVIPKTLLTKELESQASVKIRLIAKDRAEFGQTFKIKLVVK